MVIHNLKWYNRHKKSPYDALTSRSVATNQKGIDYMDNSTIKDNNCICDNCGREFRREKRHMKKGAKNSFCGKQCNYEFKAKQSYQAMCERVGTDFKEWLIMNYWEKEMPSSEIALMAYGKPKNGPNIIGWMEKLDIPKRSRTDAVALQWKDNFERRIKQSFQTIDVMGAGTESRKKLIRTMQTDEYRQKASLAKLGEKNGMYGVTRENNPMWNPELSDEERNQSRKILENDIWRKEVFERDDYTCQICKDSRGGKLVAHHLNGYHWDKDNRFNVDNGITICESHHKEFHCEYGYGNNTKEQFEEYLMASITR